LTTVVVFFPVTFLYGVSRYLFSALALAVVISLFASYFVALSVVPLFAARFLKHHEISPEPSSSSTRANWSHRFSLQFNEAFAALLVRYERYVKLALAQPWVTILGLMLVFFCSLFLYPHLGVAFFPRTDAGQFVINLKAPSGTKLDVSEQEVKKVEDLVRRVVAPEDLGMIVSNIGVTPDFSAIYTSNSAQHTGFVQVSLNEEHKTGSYEYMERVRRQLESELPYLRCYFQSGGLVDAVLNLGLAAPVDIQVSGAKIENSYKTAIEIAGKVRDLPGVSDVFIPQDLDYPALQLEIDRLRSSQLGLSQREVVNNVITALTSNQMIAPSYWVDPKSGLDYMLTVQYPEGQVKSLQDLKAVPLRSAGSAQPTRLDAVSTISRMLAPTELDHYQLRRVIDVYVGLAGEDLGRVASSIDKIIAETSVPEGVRVDLRGMVQGMRASFRSFGIGLCLAVVLLYLILVAQFESFLDPVLILLAVPMGLTGVLATLYLTGTTLNVQSLMGVVMMVGIVVSNSILIVEFTRRLREDGMAVSQAVVTACRVRLRPVLMTSLATIIGLMPMALKLGTGSEAYAPLARAIIGGLSISVILTIFIVPAAYVLAYRNHSATVQDTA
jgi:multidrug efflux pump subunit AcrB